MSPLNKAANTSFIPPSSMRRHALAIACCLALFSAQPVLAQEPTAPAEQEAPAQQADVDTLDAVVVKGIRHSIAKSVETKNQSNSIVEAITAEDIGKLPDLSIADSISRLPGLATQRVD